MKELHSDQATIGSICLVLVGQIVGSLGCVPVFVVFGPFLRDTVLPFPIDLILLFGVPGTLCMLIPAVLIRGFIFSGPSASLIAAIGISLASLVMVVASGVAALWLRPDYSATASLEAFMTFVMVYPVVSILGTVGGLQLLARRKHHHAG